MYDEGLCRPRGPRRVDFVKVASKSGSSLLKIVNVKKSRVGRAKHLGTVCDYTYRPSKCLLAKAEAYSDILSALGYTIGFGWLLLGRRRDDRSKVDTVRSEEFPGSMLVEIEAHVADSAWVARWWMSGTGGFIISE